MKKTNKLIKKIYIYINVTKYRSFSTSFELKKLISKTFTCYIIKLKNNLISCIKKSCITTKNLIWNKQFQLKKFKYKNFKWKSCIKCSKIYKKYSKRFISHWTKRNYFWRYKNWNTLWTDFECLKFSKASCSYKSLITKKYLYNLFKASKFRVDYDM